MPLRKPATSSWSSDVIGQSTTVFEAMGTIKAGEGIYPAGGLWTLDSTGQYIKVDPVATDDTKVVYAVSFERVNAETNAVYVMMGHRGVFTLERVFVPRYKTFAGDGTTTSFALGEDIFPNSVTVKVDGTFKTENVDYTVDYDNDTIDFTTAPASGATIEVWYGWALVVDRHKQFNGDGTTTTFSVGETIEWDYVEVFVDDVQQSKGVDYTVDYTTGDITFATAPASGAVIDIHYKHINNEQLIRDAEDNEIYLVQMDTTVHTT